MTTSTTFLKQPAGFRKGGRVLWQAVRDKHYVLRPDEIRVLEDACRQADLIDQLEAELRKQLDAGEYMTKGSMGQKVINPLIAEVRQHRATLASMLGRLKLPDVEGGENSAATSAGRGEQQRNAAQSRWSIPHQA